MLAQLLWMTDRYRLYANLGRTLKGKNSHLVDYAATFGVSYNFGK